MAKLLRMAQGLYHTNLGNLGVAQGAGPWYNVDRADAEALIPRGGSAKRRSRGHYAEGLWNMRILGAYPELFLVITLEDCRYGKLCISMLAPFFIEKYG